MTVDLEIQDPAAAVAISRCMLYRQREQGETRTRLAEQIAFRIHEARPCQWCDYPLAFLLVILEGFNEWAGFDPTHDYYARREIQAFRLLPRERQETLVHQAMYGAPS